MNDLKLLRELFDWQYCESKKDGNFLFFNITLKQSFNSFLVGTTFTEATFLFSEGTIAFFNHGVHQGTFQLKLIIE